MLQAGEEGVDGKWGDFWDRSGEPLEPPSVRREGGGRAPADPLGQQKRLDGLVQRMSAGFFGPFCRGLNG
jgi:hypothetical protein